jgi:hypothetical protein
MPYASADFGSVRAPRRGNHSTGPDTGIVLSRLRSGKRGQTSLWLSWTGGFAAWCLNCRYVGRPVSETDPFPSLACWWFCRLLSPGEGSTHWFPLHYALHSYFCISVLPYSAYPCQSGDPTCVPWSVPTTHRFTLPVPGVREPCCGAENSPCPHFVSGILRRGGHVTS